MKIEKIFIMNLAKHVFMFGWFMFYFHYKLLTQNVYVSGMPIKYAYHALSSIKMLSSAPIPFALLILIELLNIWLIRRFKYQSSSLMFILLGALLYTILISCNGIKGDVFVWGAYSLFLAVPFISFLAYCLLGNSGL